MIENIKIIKESLVAYIGTGLHVLLYVLAIVYIFIKEKNKNKRVFFIYFQIVMLFIVLNPIFNRIVGEFFTNKTYVRFFWVFPFGVTISYMFVCIIDNMKNNILSNITIVFFIIIICVLGKCVYMDGNFIKVDNIYKLPEESVAITKILTNDENNYKKVFCPPEIAPHIRQIDANIKLMYKRNPNTYEGNDFIEALNSGSAKEINYFAQREKSNYVVIYKNIELIGSFEEYNYKKIAETDNYIIYKYNGDI